MQEAVTLVLISESTKEIFCEVTIDAELAETINRTLAIDDETPEEEISERWKAFFKEALSLSDEGSDR